jgi:hypothetical protein
MALPAFGQDDLPPPRPVPLEPGTIPLPDVPPPLIRPMTMAEFAKVFQAAPGQYEVLLVNPVTHAPAKVCFELPPGCPKKVRVFKRQMVFDYGRRDVVIRFDCHGAVRVTYR